MLSLEVLQPTWWRGRLHNHVGWGRSHPTSLQPPQPGSMQRCKASLCCISYEWLDALLSNNIVTRVSDASLLYIIILQYTLFHSIDYSSFWDLTPSALGTFSISIRPTHRGQTVLRGGSCFQKGSVVPERLGNWYGEVAWGLLLILSGVLDLRGTEGYLSWRTYR